MILVWFPAIIGSWASYQGLDISKSNLLLVNQGGKMQSGPMDSILIIKSWLWSWSQLWNTSFIGSFQALWHASSKVYILNLNTSPIKFLFLNKVLVSRFIWHFIISFCFSKMPEECITIKQKWKYKNEIFNINPILHFKEVKLKILSIPFPRKRLTPI